MSTSVKDFSKSALGFTKSPLGIIALFIVLVYGFATLAVALGSNLKESLSPLIWFLVLFPVLVFVGFLWLVAKHHNKIYGPSDFKNEDNFLKISMASAISLAIASERHKGKGGRQLTEQERTEAIIQTVSRRSPMESDALRSSWKNRVLWVDDHPENNLHERQALETMGIVFSLALSTQEALELLKTNRFSAIISDVRRKEGDQEGYLLLDQLRASNDKTAFYFYAGSCLPEFKKQVKERGAQGGTDSAQELFDWVMDAVS